jgi:ADP-dependent NAD(P)H-hydrate dehydratase / NAD(P)H-hydrate epimerase
MKVLTAAEMREVDRRTIEAGIPGIVLMENAGHRVVEFLAERFAPLAEQRIVILCGKGNNGGDGLVIARQLHTRFSPASLHVILLAAPAELKGDAATNYTMLLAAGGEVHSEIPAAARNATLVLDALLGTGVTGPATGRVLQGIHEINAGFPLATVVAVDLPSGMPSDTGDAAADCARADYTVTFTAPKVSQVMPPNCDHVGELVVAPIGSRADFYAEARLAVLEPSMFAALLAPRAPAGHKGTYGHVLIVAGSRGKTGAAAMAGIAALRGGAGLVTVASAESAIATIAGHAPELMTEALRETESGMIALNANLAPLLEGKTVLAIGPGLGRAPHIAALVHGITESFAGPMVIDADALAGTMQATEGRLRVLTPHPGEMARLTGKSTAEIQADRIGAARDYATQHGVILVLKGQRTLIAFPSGDVHINPTGTPAMGKGGSGDILTGMIAALLAQFPNDPEQAVSAAVYLHGLAGELAAQDTGDKSLLATGLLPYLGDAVEACANVPHRV